MPWSERRERERHREKENSLNPLDPGFLLVQCLYSLTGGFAISGGVCVCVGMFFLVVDSTRSVWFRSFRVLKGLKFRC